MFAEWLQGRRKVTPTINATKFGKEIVAWWVKLRTPQVAGKGKRRATSVDDVIKVNGRNGIFLVLVGLVWWGLSLITDGQSPQSNKEWLHIFKETKEVLVGFQEESATSGKEKHPRLS